MSSLFPLLIGIVLKLNYLIKVIRSGLLLDIFEDKVLKFHFTDPERVVRMVVSFTRVVLGDH